MRQRGKTASQEWISVKLWEPSYDLLKRLAAFRTLETGKVTLSEALGWSIEQALALYEPKPMGNLPATGTTPIGQRNVRLTPQAFRQLQRVIAHRILADDNPHYVSDTCHDILTFALAKHE